MPIHDWTRVPAGHFHSFHLTWIVRLKESFNLGALPDDCYALIESHFGHPLSRILAGIPDPIALDDEPSIDDEENAYAKRRRTLAIRRASDERAVALIEIVSPGTKNRPKNAEQFARKMVDAIEAGCHVLVVDVFPDRTGESLHQIIWKSITPDDATKQHDRSPLAASYHAASPTKAYVEPISIGIELPTMPVFLERDRSVDAPLESSYQRTFDALPVILRAPLTKSA